MTEPGERVFLRNDLSRNAIILGVAEEDKLTQMSEPYWQNCKQHDGNIVTHMYSRYVGQELRTLLQERGCSIFSKILLILCNLCKK